MTQWLGTPAAFAEDLSSVSSTHIWLLALSVTPAPVIQHPLLYPARHLHTFGRNAHIHIIKNICFNEIRVGI